MEQKKQNNVILVILFIIILILGGYLVYDKVIKKEEKKVEKTEKIEKKDEIPKEQSPQTDIKKYCEGTYYGETTGKYANGLSYDFKYTYILKNDGTYTSDFGGVSGQSGTYEINGEKIIFTHKSEVTGPNGETSDIKDEMTISNDCSYILYDKDNITFKLNKK